MLARQILDRQRSGGRQRCAGARGLDRQPARPPLAQLLKCLPDATAACRREGALRDSAEAHYLGLQPALWQEHEVTQPMIKSLGTTVDKVCPPLPLLPAAPQGAAAAFFLLLAGCCALDCLWCIPQRHTI